MASTTFKFVCFCLVACVLFEAAFAAKFLHHIRGFNAKQRRSQLLNQKNIQGGPQAQWFTKQAVDHFDETNTAVWSQRYFVNDSYWQQGGPVFLLLGGEAGIAPDDVLSHFIITDYAAQFGALVLSVEHRFYGQSIPTGDLSTNNLHLLTSQQALADYASFRQYIDEIYNTSESKWIVFGGSYSGALSAWFRLKYPHLAVGSIATSAPVLAQLDFPEYFEVVSRSVGPACSKRIQQGTMLVEQLLTSNDGIQKLQTLFQTCTPLKTPKDITNFLSALTGGIAEIVQYNNDNNLYTPFNVDKMCSILMQGDDVLAAYANFNQIFNTFSGTNCTEVSYKDYIAGLQNTDPTNPNAAGRSWTWQTCIEFGFFQTAEGDNQPFSQQIDLDFYVEMCNDIFGKPYTPNVAWTNTYYGAKNISSSNIVFPNGSVDPWHILGITDSQHPNSMPSCYMQGTAHCADLYPPRPSDLPDLVNTREIEMELLAKWLSF